jgi:hypothetical protein
LNSLSMGNHLSVEIERRAPTPYTSKPAGTKEPGKPVVGPI